MSVNLYSGLTTAQIIAQGVAPIILVDASGNTVDFVSGSSFGAGVTSVNGIAPTVTIGGQGIISVSTTGSLITISATGSGTGDVVGPSSATDNAIALYNGTTGKVIKDSALTVVGAALIGTPTLDISTTGTFNLTGDTYLNLQSNGNVFVDALGGSFIVQDANILPDTSGTRALGSNSIPFLEVHANQYKTSFPSTIGGNVSIDWNNGTSQTLNFNGVASGTYTIGFDNGAPGSAYVLQTIQNGSGTITLAFSGTQTAWQGGITGTTSSTAGAIDLFSFIFNGTKYLGTFSNNYA